MSESIPFEIPAASEKQAYKYILDSLKETLPADEELVVIEAKVVVIEQTPAQEQLELVAPPLVIEVTEGDEPVSLVERTPVRPLDLPEGKKYFRIGEVSELIGVEPYVLRYWEGEFSNIRPEKSGSGHRVYSRKDVEILNLVRHLLHEEKFSIRGAKKRISEMKKEAKSPQAGVSKQRHVDHLKLLAHELKALIALAKNNPGVV